MAVWQAFFCLTVVAFLCRAVIPVGYMPDLSGERDSTFAITLCVAGGGTAVMQLDFSDDGEPASDEATGFLECPFGLAALHKLAPGQDAPALAGTVAPFRPIVAVVRNQALPPMPALGPPLGSRAPPLNLG